MEMLIFYWPNILAASLLVLILGLLGQHLVARNQSMEVMLLGQEFQTGILVAALLQSTPGLTHETEHGLHGEALVSLIFALIAHSFYLYWIRKHRAYRIEGAIVGILLLTGFSHLIVALSPSVEFHMVQAALGDIVTVGQFEALAVAVFSVLLLLLYRRESEVFFQETLEISIFNQTTKRITRSFYFQVLLTVTLFVSIHLFGTLFTIGSMLIPAFISSIFRMRRQNYSTLLVLNSGVVVLAFGLTVYWDRLPTTVVIVLGQFLFLLFYAALKTKIQL